MIAYNRSQSQKALDMGIEYRSLDEVLEESDIISLNLPLNDETRGFIDKEKISKMKSDAVFINCARGPIVDNQALAEALNEDKLGFACVDVFDMEPPIPEDYPLLHAKNTLLTPHQAFISEESMLRRAEIVFQNVFAYVVSLMVYQIGTFIMGGGFGIGTAVAFVLLAVMLYLLFRPDPYKDQKVWSKRSLEMVH